MPLSSEKARELGKLGGRPKGSYSKKTLDKMKMKARLDQRILRAADRLATAQIHIATGQTFLYKIEKEWVSKGTNKDGEEKGYYKNLPPKRVTAQWEIEQYLEGVSEGNPNDDQDPAAAYYYLTTKEPNNEALKDLWNRVHGMPKATLESEVTVKFSLKELAARRSALNLPNTVVVPPGLEDKKE